MNTLTRKLIAKELYVNRWFLIGTAVSAVAAMAVAPFGQTAFNIAGLAWLTTLIGCGVMLAIYHAFAAREPR